MMDDPQASKRRKPLSGWSAALARGRAALADWVSTRVVLSGPAFAAKLGVPVQAVGASVRRGELFSIGISGRRYYVSTLLQVEPAAAAAVCRALTGLEEMEKVIFWLRPHGALGAQTVAAALGAGEFERVVALAHANAAQARAARLGLRNPRQRRRGRLTNC